MPEYNAAEAAEAFLQLGEHCVSILDAVAGHRESAISRGFSETVAEQMALQYHMALMGHFAKMLVSPA